MCVLSVTPHNNPMRWLDPFSFAMRRSSLRAVSSLPSWAKAEGGESPRPLEPVPAPCPMEHRACARRSTGALCSKRVHCSLPPNLHVALQALPDSQNSIGPVMHGSLWDAKQLKGKPFSSVVSGMGVRRTLRALRDHAYLANQNLLGTPKKGRGALRHPKDLGILSYSC